jgi:hypothetical protein
MEDVFMEFAYVVKGKRRRVIYARDGGPVSTQAMPMRRGALERMREP